MSTSKASKSWWAASSTRARLTAAGASAIVLALLTTSIIVWSSPANPVNQAIAAGSTEPTREELLTAERNNLLSQVVELKNSLAEGDTDLEAMEAEMATVQQALWSAEGKLEAIENAPRSPSGAAKPAPKPPVKPRPTTVTVAGETITAPSKAEIVNPASAYFGMYTEQAPFNWASFDLTATKVGSEPNVVGYFGGWDENYRANAVTRAWQRDTLPILTWEGRPIGAANDVREDPLYSLPRILGDPAAGVPGAFDEYLRQYARDIVSTGLPLGIRLNHEMNGDWYPWAEVDKDGDPINGNRRGDYAKTWQYVHDIFEQEGANDLVVWIWAPNIINRLPGELKSSAYLDSLYPGDAYVDWVGVSAYLRPPFSSDITYDFDYTFTPTLNELRRITDKPIFLAEIGASEIGGLKSAWIGSFFEALARPENGDVLGFSWFNLAVTSRVQGQLATNDWRIDSRDSSVTAFREGLVTPGSRFVLTPR